MSLTQEQIDKLLGLVSTTQDDPLDCDGCLSMIAEFADANLSNRPLTEALRAVEAHLESCICCEHEYQALLEGLRTLEDDDADNVPLGT